VLGYKLRGDQEREAALEVISTIHANTGEHELTRPQATTHRNSDDTSFAGFAKFYLQYIKAKRPKNDGRNEIILNRHLLPHFGSKQLSDICLEDGLAYLEKRQGDCIGSADRRHPVAAGTIERECAVLVAVLNLAVDMDYLDKNRLKRLPVPEYAKRERIVEGWELLKIREAASPNVWRVIMAAL
jgi:hypothetical protein